MLRRQPPQGARESRTLKMGRLYSLLQSARSRIHWHAHGAGALRVRGAQAAGSSSGQPPGRGGYRPSLQAPWRGVLEGLMG